MLVAITQSAPSVAGDGKISENFSVQFNSGTGFAPEISVPPQDDNYGAYLVLPPCIGPVQNDCIVSVEYSDAQGRWVKGKFREFIPLNDLIWNDPKFKEDYNSLDASVFAKARPLQNFPAGGRTSVWDLTDASHPGGTGYAVTLGFPGAASNVANPRAAGSVISWQARDGFTVKLFPLSYEKDAKVTDAKEKVAGSCSGSFGKAQFRCAVTTVHPFPAKTKFRVTANFGATKTMLNGSYWYFGRIINSQISQSSKDDGSILLSIQGSPTYVGTVQTEFPKSDENYEVLRKAYELYSEATYGDKTSIFIAYDQFLQAQGSGLSTRDPGTTGAWRILEEKFEFRYLSEEETWQAASSRMSREDLALTEKCGSSQLLPGIITTNAVAANPSPPKWDPSSGELVYMIASPHTRQDGKVNVGVYEMSIDKKLAECLWGKDPLQYRASISVQSTDGTQKLATTLFSSSDRFLSFRAAGFSYSTSVVRVKLTKGQGKEAIREDLPDFYLESVTNTTKGVTSKVGAKKSITCAKGKREVKVTGSTLKCPKGYKRIA